MCRGIMDQQLALMAQTASTTMVALMATDVWQRAREGVVGVWRRIHPAQADAVGTSLDEVRGEVLVAREQGDDALEQALATEWSGRLGRLLLADPTVGQELTALLEALRAQLPDSDASRVPTVTMTARASGHGRVYQAGRDQHITER